MTLDPETPIDRVLRATGSEPLCNDCAPCGTRWQQLHRRLNRRLTTPFMDACLVTLGLLIAGVFVGLAVL